MATVNGNRGGEALEFLPFHMRAKYCFGFPVSTSYARVKTRSALLRASDKKRYRWVFRSA